MKKIDTTLLPINKRGEWLITTRDGREAQIYTTNGRPPYTVGVYCGNVPYMVCANGIRNVDIESPEDLIMPLSWTLGDEINGFKLGRGQQWHRNGWTQDMLPAGTRSLILGEKSVVGDYRYVYGVGPWQMITNEPLPGTLFGSAGPLWAPCATSRPIPAICDASSLDAAVTVDKFVLPGQAVRKIGDEYASVITDVLVSGVVIKTDHFPWDILHLDFEINRHDANGWLRYDRVAHGWYQPI